MGGQEPRIDPVTGEHVEQLLGMGLDRYALQRLLGVGGMGEVYLGLHRTIEKEVAVKVLAYEHRNDPRLNERFLDEARAASKIRHPNVVDITDFGHTPQGCAYFVMEYLAGEDLADTLQREVRLPWARAQHLVVQMLDALHAAHAQGIVHRDVKPANCMRVTQGRDPDFLKVLDFGIARLSERGSDESGTGRLTKTGTIMGTAEYMSPEQARGEEVDARTDLYAVGVVLFELLTGQLPFTGRASVEVLSKHIFEPPPEASSLAPDAGITPEVDALLARALAKDPDERFADAEAMIEAIEAIEGFEGDDLATGGSMLQSRNALAPTMVASPPTGSDTDAGHPAPEPEPERRRLPWRLAGLAGLAVAGVGTWMVLAGSPPSPDERCPEGMALITGGSFFMGTDDEAVGALQSARPTHRMEVGDYCISRHEVTVAQFHACSDQGQCRRPFKDSRWPQGGMSEAKWTHAREQLSTQCNETIAGHEEHPVNCVTWEQARDYCAHVGQRLPTEAEWEFAARGSDGRIFPWGDAEPTHEHGNLCNAECLAWRKEHRLAPEGNLTETDDGWPGTAPVGSYPAGVTQHGLHDMVGNVFEWTATEFALYDGHPEDAYQSEGRVIRGGAHNSGYAVFSDPALRFGLDPAAHTHAVGFRCAADPSPG